MQNLFKYESKTITGAGIAFISYLLIQFGGFDEGEIALLLSNIGQIVGIAVVWFDRVKKGDVNLLGWRKR